MARREVYRPQSNTRGAGCWTAVALLALAGALIAGLTGWHWPLLFAVPGACVVVVELRDRFVIASSTRYLRAHRKAGLLIYSDSPLWRDYIDANWLPRLQGSLEILNWSERRHWSASDPRVRLFRTVVGETEDFNPAAVLLRDRGAPVVFRFYPAFKNAKHGNREGLEMLEQELFETIVPAR